MKSLSVLIVDDEPLARETVRLLLAGEPGIHSVAEAASGVQALERLQAETFDVVFLDIQMPGLNGFEVLARVTAPLPAIVFVTAYDQYAVRAFDVHAIDYLLKPFTDARFHEALERMRQRRDLEGPSEVSALVEEIEAARCAAPLTRLLVRAGERLIVVRAEQLDWIEAADYYARLHVGTTSYLVREALADFEKKLDPAHFFRTHRSAIVNVDRVREIHATFKGEAVVRLQSGVELPLSRSRRDEFERILGRLR